MITEKTKQQLIDLNDSRVNEILNLGLKVGEWYKGTKDFQSLIYITDITKEYSNHNEKWYSNIKYYGFLNKRWSNGTIANISHEESLTKANKQEIEQALITEAKRRGFKKGIRVDRFWRWVSVFLIRNNNFELKGNNTLLLDGIEIFENGHWAEIIDDKSELKQELKELELKLKQIREKL